MDVPPIITEAELEAVHAALQARSPQWMPPRAVSGPTLRTGILLLRILRRRDDPAD